MHNSVVFWEIQLILSCKICSGLLGLVAKCGTKSKLCTQMWYNLYKVVSDIVHLQQNQQDMASYLGQVESLKDKFDSLMPFTGKSDYQDSGHTKLKGSLWFWLWLGLWEIKQKILLKSWII